jgi:undecaprenyl-diphosphatase
MDWLQAFLLGLVQGLTEFLPVSSSGHIELGKYLLGTDIEGGLSFTIVVHGATVLSTIIVFRKDILSIIRHFFMFRMNDSTHYVFKILISMIPAIAVGLFLEDQIETLFTGNILFVGIMLLITATLLILTFYAKDKKKDISYGRAFIIGIAQALAVLPGISRSGATIATGLYLKIDKNKIARFSFLMVILPILGKNFLDIFSGELSQAHIPVSVLIIGFISAFLSGLLACKLMIKIVSKGNLTYFALYCLMVGIVSIVLVMN